MMVDKLPQSTFVFDFDKMTAKEILNVTLNMRAQVVRRKQSGPPTLTYTVRCNQIKNLYAVGEQVQLFPKESKKFVKVTTQTVDKIDKECTVLVTISVDTIYPVGMGYLEYRRGGGKDSLVTQEQCYHLEINGRIYTPIGINYSLKLQNPPRFTDMLGILIAEQIRFDTLEVYLQTFPFAEQMGVQELYSTLYANFKTDVYNDWNKDWKQRDDLQPQSDKLREIRENQRLKVEKKEEKKPEPKAPQKKPVVIDKKDKEKIIPRPKYREFQQLQAKWYKQTAIVIVEKVVKAPPKVDTK